MLPPRTTRWDTHTPILCLLDPISTAVMKSASSLSSSPQLYLQSKICTLHQNYSLPGSLQTCCHSGESALPASLEICCQPRPLEALYHWVLPTIPTIQEACSYWELPSKPRLETTRWLKASAKTTKSSQNQQKPQKYGTIRTQLSYYSNLWIL